MVIRIVRVYWNGMDEREVGIRLWDIEFRITKAFRITEAEYQPRHLTVLV